MYTKATAARTVEVPLDFPRLYGATKFLFTCKRTTRKDKDASDQITAIAPRPEDAVDWLAEMLVQPPLGFGDFPLSSEELQAVISSSDQAADSGSITTSMPILDKPLSDRVRAYFLDPERPELVEMAGYVREAYLRIVLPTFLLRGV